MLLNSLAWFLDCEIHYLIIMMSLCTAFEIIDYLNSVKYNIIINLKNQHYESQYWYF